MTDSLHFSVNVEFLPVSEISLEEETLLICCERQHTAKPSNFFFFQLTEAKYCHTMSRSAS